MNREKFGFINLQEKLSMKDAQSLLQNRSAIMVCAVLVLIAVLAWQPTITVAAQAGFESAVTMHAGVNLPESRATDLVKLLFDARHS